MQYFCTSTHALNFTLFLFGYTQLLRLTNSERLLSGLTIPFRKEKKDCSIWSRCVQSLAILFGTAMQSRDGERYYTTKNENGQDFPIFMKLTKSNMVKNNYKINVNDNLYIFLKNGKSRK